MMKQKYNKDFMVPLIGTLSRNPEIDDSIIPHDDEPEVPEEERKERVRPRTKEEQRFEEERNFYEYMKGGYTQTQIIETVRQLTPYVPSRIFNTTIFAKQNFIRVTPQAFRELKAQVFDLSPDVIADMEHEYNVVSHAKGSRNVTKLFGSKYETVAETKQQMHAAKGKRQPKAHKPQPQKEYNLRLRNTFSAYQCFRFYLNKIHLMLSSIHEKTTLRNTIDI
ncbi:hypothetical protein PAPYR_12019 [Paratrimastix pyriformis]|uniref:Uncharacterized protein n=1 Tax=Paratrimastix pyriformis TaxID=342808 RepID=A0ABQ8U2M2_9EUKA|nr:hypothetical protein PAPYR_12019 [Paratrimastix pyriformis]